MKLCKFQSFSEYSLAGLANNSLWFSPLQSFNDPFEGRFSIDRAYSFKSKSDAEVFVNKAMEFFRGCANPDKFINAIEEKRNLDEKITTILAFLLKVIVETSQELVQSEGYCCFCAGDDSLANQLMWSHYSNGFRGLCLVFDEERLHESLNSLNDMDDLCFFPIDYRHGMPKLGLAHVIDYLANYSNHIEGLYEEFQVLQRTSKSHFWSYEKEIRAVSIRAGSHAYSDSSLKQVIVGEKMPLDFKRTLLRVLESKSEQPDVREAFVEEGNYNLSLRDVRA